jgi:predicted nuclease of predicted toxin-antitoxin system
MRFLADECCDSGLVEFLRSTGHQVDYIQELLPGVTDIEVLLKAKNDKRILLTEDKDFGELVFRLKKPAYGIILLRFHPVEKDKKYRRLQQLVSRYSSKLPGNLIVVDTKKIRFRPLK